MPKGASPSPSIPLTSVPLAGGSASASASLHPPGHHDSTVGFDSSSRGSSSDLVHVSKETSRQGTPFTPDEDDEEEDFANMPSDLRPSMEDKSSHHQPLLSTDKSRHSYDDSVRPGLSTRRSSRFGQRDPEIEAHKATRKRYTIAGAFLLVSLVSFAVQTETAVYIQHNLKWNKAYCML